MTSPCIRPQCEHCLKRSKFIEKNIFKNLMLISKHAWLCSFCFRVEQDLIKGFHLYIDPPNGRRFRLLMLQFHGFRIWYKYDTFQNRGDHWFRQKRKIQSVVSLRRAYTSIASATVKQNKICRCCFRAWLTLVPRAGSGKCSLSFTGVIFCELLYLRFQHYIR